MPSQSPNVSWRAPVEWVGGVLGYAASNRQTRRRHTITRGATANRLEQLSLVQRTAHKKKAKKKRIEKMYLKKKPEKRFLCYVKEKSLHKKDLDLAGVLVTVSVSAAVSLRLGHG